MLRYIVKRLLLFIPTVFLASLFVFLLMRIVPGDPALIILGGLSGEGTYTQQDLENLQRELGTDRNIAVQYGDWAWGILHGDLGKSLFRDVPVTDDLKFRIPLTLELAVMASIISFLLAVPLGVVSALKPDSIFDYAARIFTFTGISIPIFVSGIVVVYVLVNVFSWFPPIGYAHIWDEPLKNLQQMIFPAVTLAFYQMNFIARVTRSAMLEVMREDYIRTARSKGLRESSVVLLHALKNAFLPVITVSGWAFGLLLGGTVIIEKIFAVHGMGTLLLDSILARDYTMIQAMVLIFTVGVMTVNLIVDLVYAWVDPRIRYA